MVMKTLKESEETLEIIILIQKYVAKLQEAKELEKEAIRRIEAQKRRIMNQASVN